MTRAERLVMLVDRRLRDRLYRCFRARIGPARASKLWGCEVSEALACFKLWQQRRNTAARAAGMSVRKVRRPRHMGIWPGSYVGPRRGLAAVTSISPQVSG